jgi:asparagine synthase (glutamine-hydrolysing)
MCGITGFWERNQSGRTAYPLLQNMTCTLAHRGPDDQGHWVDPNVGIGLGHRRLSILDLSPEGHQPMFSASGRYVIVFNGEVYNYADIRQELPRTQWRGHSDTEVILEAFERWGVADAVTRFIGMFAFALWDRQDRRLCLVRDRLGIKPLYYGWSGNTLLFGSELKSLRRWPEFEAPIDRNSVALFLRHNYIPAPYTIYQGFHKLMPGTIAVFDDPHPAQPSIETYWSAQEVVERGLRTPFRGNSQEAVEQLESLLRDAIKLRMISDVPLGAFLSGGIDSSTVVALMQAQSARPVKTFSIGFHEKQYNEAHQAAMVAQHLGTDHTELYVTPEEAMAVIPRLGEIYDEPFADSSQIPTLLVSQLARPHVTVSLSGDGGDEVFGGYTRYLYSDSVWKGIGRVPVFLRQPLARFLTSLSPESWDAVLSPISPVLPARWQLRTPGTKVHKLADLLTVNQREELYRRLVSSLTNPVEFVPGSVEPTTLLSDRTKWPTISDFVSLMAYLDTVSYLPDDILTKVDRATMAVSLEGRVPLLDHRVVEFCWSLPASLKWQNATGKWVLRQVLERHVPKQLFERPKMGFGIPVATWITGPLRDWVESLLNENTLRNQDIFDPSRVRRMWKEHESGKAAWGPQLWGLLMFQAWLAQCDSRTSEMHQAVSS